MPGARLILVAAFLASCGRVGFDVAAESHHGDGTGDSATGGATGAGASGLDASSGASSSAGGSIGSGAATAAGGSTNAGGGSAGAGGTGAAGAAGASGNGGAILDASTLDSSAGGSGTGGAGTGGAGTGGAGTGGAGTGGAGTGGGPGCGDGIVQSGEQCDTSGASATCDVDCTFASCGDGVLNGLAGEQCDSGDELTTCGANCKVETCRAGCTCEWYFGRRYMFCPDKLNSTPATAACNATGMRTVRLQAGQEQSWIRLRSQQDAYAKFHIGASDAAVEGAWRWEDGTQFWSGGSASSGGVVVASKFSWWAGGEPNDQGGLEDCGEIQSIQGWNDSRCDFEAKPFVCKQYRDPRPQCGDGVVQAGEACDTGVQSATCDGDCSPPVCGDGNVNALAGEACDDAGTGQYCNATCTAFVCPAGYQCFAVGSGSFALSTAPLSFRDAAVACGKKGMALAQIPSMAVDQGLRTRANTSGVSAYWVGGTDLDSEGNWMWVSTLRFWTGTSSGTALAYENFPVATAPNGGAAANCLEVTAGGAWSDADCATTLPYMCERLLP